MQEKIAYIQTQLQSAKIEIKAFVQRHPILVISIPTAAVATYFTIYFQWHDEHSDDKLSKIHYPDDVCILQPSTYDACRYGLEQGISLVRNTVTDICHANIHFDYEQLYPLCEKFYNNANNTAACLSGVFDATSTQKTIYKLLCNMQKDAAVEAAKYTSEAFGYLFAAGAVVFSGKKIKETLDTTETGQNIKQKCSAGASAIANCFTSLWHKVRAPGYETIAHNGDRNINSVLSSDRDDFDTFINDEETISHNFSK